VPEKKYARGCHPSAIVVKPKQPTHAYNASVKAKPKKAAATPPPKPSEDKPSGGDTDGA